MLLTLGRGLSPVSSGAPRKTFDLTSQLPPDMAYTRSDTAATVRNASGVLVRSAANAPRFDHTSGGVPLGLLIEGTRQNKCALYNAAPSTTAGLSVVAGTPTVSVVSDATALGAAGLDQVGNGKAFKIEAGAADCEVNFDGEAGNLNPHSYSLYARVSAGSAWLKRSGTASPLVAIAGGAYARYRLENDTPSATTDKLRIKVGAGGVFYGLLMQIEEGAFASSAIVTEGAAATRATETVRILSPGDRLYFDEKQGYLAARYRPAVVATGADQFLLAAHNGSSVETMGFRVHKTDTDIQAWVRDDSISLNIYTDDVPHGAGQVQAAGLSWKPGSSTTLHGGAMRTTTYATNPSGFTEISIGHRNGALDPFWGHIARVEIGAVPLAGAAPAARLYGPGDTVAVGGGQSLMVGHFSSQQSGSEQGRTTFVATLYAARPHAVALFINGATGSTAASKTSNPTNYWWDLATSSRGPAFATFYTRIADSGLAPNAVFWSQGEEDSHQIGIGTTRQQYKDALTAIFADMRAMLGPVPIVIQRIGRRGAFATTGGVQAVREVQQELIDAYAWCHGGAETYDQGLYDQVHLSDAGYVAAGLRNARKYLAAVLGESVSGVDGPALASATRSGTSVSVTLTHDGGSDFSPSSGIEGFRFFDDGAEIAVTSAVRTNATTVTLTLASVPSGSVRTLYYGYDAMLGLNAANVIRDNAPVPMPLRTGKLAVN